MPSLKRNVKNAPDRSGFETYDGPDPIPQGLYEGVIKSVKIQKTRAGDFMFRLLAELDDTSTERKQLTVGFPAWGNLVLMDKEALLAKEKAFYRAITGKQDVEDVNVVYDDGIDDGAVKVSKVGGKDPVGVRVKVEIQDDEYQGKTRSALNAIYPLGKTATPAKADVDDEPEDSVEESDVDETVETEELDAEAREAELKALGIAALRRLAESDYDLDTKGLKKAELVEAILDHEFGEEGSEEEDESDEEEEEDDGEEEAEEETDPLADLDRNAIKAQLKENSYTGKILKSHSDDDLREILRGVLAADEDSDDEEDEEEVF